MPYCGRYVLYVQKRWPCNMFNCEPKSFCRCASVNSSSAPPPPPPPRANPQALAFLEKKNGKFPGVGMKEPGKCPAPGLIVFNLSIGDIRI